MQVRSAGILGGLGVVLGAFLQVGCGSGRSSDAFAVSPSTAAVTVGERLVMVARPGEAISGDLEWEVAEPNGGGLLQSRGFQVTYVAPAVAGTYHLQLRAQRAGGGVLRQEEEVRVRPVVRVEPAAITVAPGGTVQFSVRQKGLARGTMTWSVEDADGGSISPDGTYRAPAARGTYRVLAASAEDKETVVSATVTVQ